MKYKCPNQVTFKSKTALYLLLTIAAFILPMQPAAATKSSPTVTIAGPNDKNSLLLSEPTLKVQITNTSNSNLKIWGENCSWGYCNIAFLAKSGNESVLLTRNERNWKKNGPVIITLNHGETTSREINLADNSWPIDKLNDFCKNHKSVKLSATYSIAQELLPLEAREVWNGKVKSTNSLEISSK